MAGGPEPSRLGRLRLSGTALSILLAVSVCLPAAAQTQLTLQQVSARTPGDFLPVHANESVVVTGVVNAAPFRFPKYSLLGLQDNGYGAVLKLDEDDRRADQFRPGDQLRVTGTVSAFNGMVVILPQNLEPLGQTKPPVPLDVTVGDLEKLQYLGRLVRTQLKIVGVGDTANGPYLEVEGPELYKIFVPRDPTLNASLGAFAKGDTVQAVGVAYQYCSLPPYNRFYQLLVHDPGAIIRKERSFPPFALAAALAIILLGGFFLWTRERRMRSQRETLRMTYQLGEEILGASSAESMLKRIAKTLPGILGVTRVRLYTFNRAAKTLDEVSEDAGLESSISLSAPPGGTQAGAVACFHYRTLLVIPDIDRSPFPITANSGDTPPRSLLFVPMFAQGDVIGVLELDQDEKVRDFSPAEQELAQHLGNQIGVAIRLLDQRSVREQLFRTEKLAAVGRLISGVVNELQTPLASITELANRAVERSRNTAAEREVIAIASEAQKATAMVARLVSFAAAEQVEARPVSINALLRTLIEFRESEWKASGIRVRDLTTRENVFVLGSQGQLEQVFLNLFVHAEQSLADAPQKVITIRTSVLAKRLLVEVGFTAPAGLRKPEETAAVLGVTRSVIAGHGGEVRLIEKGNTDPRFEVELPASARDRNTPSSSGMARVTEFSRTMTALVIEPDESAQRQILGLLGARGYRVVPVNNSDTGLDLAHRLRFDVAFCSVHAPGLNWVELSERLHSRVGAFVLLSDGYDSELSADFEGDERFVLAKPVQEQELERVLRTLEPSIPSAKSGVA